MGSPKKPQKGTKVVIDLLLLLPLINLQSVFIGTTKEYYKNQ